MIFYYFKKKKKKHSYQSPFYEDDKNYNFTFQIYLRICLPGFLWPFTHTNDHPFHWQLHIFHAVFPAKNSPEKLLC